MKKMALAMAAMITMMALPVEAATDSYECSILVGIGVITINPDAILQNGFPGIGGCFLGTMENGGAADVSVSSSCIVRADTDGRVGTDVDVTDSVEAGWNVWVFCDAGVVNEVATLTVTY